MRIRPMCFAKFASVAAGMALFLPIQASAQTWTSPQLIENGGVGVVSTNGTGTSAVISGGVAAISTNGKWGSPVTLSSAAQISSIAVAPNGDVLAVWGFRTSNTYIPTAAQAAFYSGGKWGSVVTISSNIYGDVYSYGLPSIGFDGQSRATVVWEQITNPNAITCSLMAVTGTATSGFDSPQTISNANTCYGWTRMAVNQGGEAVVVEGAPGILSAAVVAVSRGTEGSWTVPVTLQASQYRQRQPRVGLGNDGTAVAVWTQRTTASYAVRSPNGTWGAAAPLPGARNTTNTSFVAVDGSGNAVAVWEQYQLPSGILTNYLPAGGSWGTPVLLENSGPVAAAATPGGSFVVASGDAVFVWWVGLTSWQKTAFSSVSNVAAGPGLAIAAVAPQISVSTAVVP